MRTESGRCSSAAKGRSGMPFAVAWKRSRHGLGEMARAQWISRCVSYGRSLSLPFAPLSFSFSTIRDPPPHRPPPFSHLVRSFLLHDLLLHRALFIRRFGMLVFLVDISPAQNCFKSGVLASFNSAEMNEAKYRTDKI